MHTKSTNNLRGLIVAVFFLFVTQIDGDNVISQFQFMPRTDIKGRLLTPEEGCGYVKVATTRIVGGGIAKNGAWPWMAIIGYKNESRTIFKCGGSLITSKHVLTAAHCFKVELNLVRLGEYDRSTKSDGPHQDIRIADVEVHIDYDSFFKINDIAMIYLEHDVEFTDRITPICLPVDKSIRSRDFTGSNPFVAGWGRTTEKDSKLSIILRQLQVPIIANSECKKKYQKVDAFYANIQFSNRVICAGGLVGQGTWLGDSGGPLMLPIHRNGTSTSPNEFPFYQIGIVSYSHRCAREDVPGVYASVQYHVNWIKMKLEEHENDSE